jgi:hypothetical protein
MNPETEERVFQLDRKARNRERSGAERRREYRGPNALAREKTVGREGVDGVRFGEEVAGSLIRTRPFVGERGQVNGLLPRGGPSSSIEIRL